MIRAFKEAGIHQHMYTNGALATEENLRALGEAGLDELRFNLGASELLRQGDCRHGDREEVHPAGGH